ncbi:MAG: Gfo/Idh/MocA family oxidoreductase [Anaerolineae bacterium]|nr:Gfo/Idh/MocA family oxidoreductase [Anaerolineae bacterium]
MTIPVDAILIGAGNRGAETYGRWALEHPGDLRIVAIAEPDAARRTATASGHGVPAERQFSSWEDLLSFPQMARAAIVATQDQMHTAPALAALNAGYDVLLEKPMAHRLEECAALALAAERAGQVLQICHVLRYTEFYRRIHEMIQSGRLGQVITIAHRENVSSWHMAHSYVRGNWRSAGLSSPMILAKSCHDLDILCWLVGSRPSTVSSVGSLRHFRPENAPEGAPPRCTDGCPAAEACPFYAPLFYSDLEPMLRALTHARGLPYRVGAWLALHQPGLLRALAAVTPPLRRITEYDGWPRSVITGRPTDPEAVRQALREGPYGRCVYHCDNDVVDHQVVALEFGNGVSASHTMHGHSHDEGRTLRIDGSRATLLAELTWSRTLIEIHEHRGGRIERTVMPTILEQGGHGGGDQGLMRAFVSSLRGDGNQPVLTSARESLESHLLAFAAEEARLAHTVIHMADFRARAEQVGVAYLGHLKG